MHTSVSCVCVSLEKNMCFDTETEVADHTWYPTQSPYTDAGLASPSTGPVKAGA